jgi:hypothetical protein
MTLGGSGLLRRPTGAFAGAAPRLERNACPAEPPESTRSSQPSSRRIGRLRAASRRPLRVSSGDVARGEAGELAGHVPKTTAQPHDSVTNRSDAPTLEIRQASHRRTTHQAIHTRTRSCSTRGITSRCARFWTQPIIGPSGSMGTNGWFRDGGFAVRRTSSRCSGAWANDQFETQRVT